MDYFKVYDSGHLFGIGRAIVISAVHQESNKIILETYGLSLYDDSFFKGTIAIYDFDASELIDDEIYLHVTKIIDHILMEKYITSKDPYLLQKSDPTEIKESTLIFAKSEKFHIEKFKDISENSSCEALRKYLKMVLEIPEVTILDYP